MSTYFRINGVVTVKPKGRTQAEKQYVLETVLQHLPLVTGIDTKMNVHIVPCYSGGKSDFNLDEFGKATDNIYPWKERAFVAVGDAYNLVQSEKPIFDSYTLVLDAALWFIDYDKGCREFQKWLCRLAKRVLVNTVVVALFADDSAQSMVLSEYDNVYVDMFEDEQNWCDFLLWKPALTEYNPYTGDFDCIPQEHLDKYRK